MIRHDCHTVSSSGPSIACQRGATLLVALIFLIVLSLLVFSGMSAGVFGFRVAANMQYQKEAASAAQAAIDSEISTLNYFKASSGSATDTISGYSIAVTRRCLGIDNSEEAGSKTQVASVQIANPTPHYLWEIQATATNSITGVAVTLNQGVKIIMDVGSDCPDS